VGNFIAFFTLSLFCEPSLFFFFISIDSICRKSVHYYFTEMHSPCCAVTETSELKVITLAFISKNLNLSVLEHLHVDVIALCFAVL